MKPYYEASGITIYHGDCREILPALPILPASDLLLTDPPYGIGNDCDYSRFPKGGNTFQQLHGDDEPFDPEHLFNFTQAIIWGANHFSARLPIGAWLIWQKTIQPNPYYSDAEIAWCSKGRAVRIFRVDQLPPDQSPRNGNRIALHPTQKPVALMKWCLGFFPMAKLVIDPYCGSGTTLEACKDAGIAAIGIEIEEEYCERAAKRLSQEVFQF